MIKPLKAAAIAGAVALTFASTAALAQNAAPMPSAKQKVKAQPKAAVGPTVAVTIANKRKAAVVELDVAVSGSPAFKPLLRNLAPGKQEVVTLAHDAICTFDFYVKYDDGETGTVPNVHVCEDGKLNLVE